MHVDIIKLFNYRTLYLYTIFIEDMCLNLLLEKYQSSVNNKVQCLSTSASLLYG